MSGAMIRFVDIRDADTGYRFSFWNTVKDQYCTFRGNQAWDTFADFNEDFQNDDSNVYKGDLDRFMGLSPLWTFSGYEDDDQLD